MKIVFFENHVGLANTIKTGRAVGSGLMFLWMEDEDGRRWMKPPPTFVNKRKLVILLVLLCLVGMSSHYVKFGDLLFGDPLVEGSDAGGGYGLPPPHSGVTGSGGGIDCRWCGEHTHQIPPTYARIQGKHVNQTCLHTRSYGGRCEGAWGRILGGNAPHSTPNHLPTFVCDIGRDWTRGDDYVRVCDHAPTQEFGGSGDGVRAALTHAKHQGTIWEWCGVRGLHTDINLLSSS